MQAKPHTIYNVRVSNTTTNTLVFRTLFAAPLRQTQEQRPQAEQQQQEEGEQLQQQQSTCVQPTKCPQAFQLVALPSGESLANLLTFLKTSHLHYTSEEVKKCKNILFP